MLIGAPLQKLRHSVRSHPLKGVEPELFSPEELLGGARRALPSTSRPAFGSQTPPQSQPALHRSDSETSDRQQSGSWFQLPWKVSQQDEAPQSRRISRDDRGLPLNQPPLVSVDSCPQDTLSCSGRACFVIAAGHSQMYLVCKVRATDPEACITETTTKSAVIKTSL